MSLIVDRTSASRARVAQPRPGGGSGKKKRLRKGLCCVMKICSSEGPVIPGLQLRRQALESNCSTLSSWSSIHSFAMLEWDEESCAHWETDCWWFLLSSGLIWRFLELRSNFCQVLKCRGVVFLFQELDHKCYIVFESYLRFGQDRGAKS